VSLNGLTSGVETTETVANPYAFFPDIDLQVFIDNYRLPAEFKESTLLYELKNAMRQVNDELTDQVLILQSVVVAETLASFDMSLVDVYKTAVMHWARSGLIKYFETLNRNKAAEIQAERSEILVNEWKSEAYKTIDQISKKIMAVAEQNEALPMTRYSSGFRASLL